MIFLYFPDDTLRKEDVHYGDYLLWRYAYEKFNCLEEHTKKVIKVTNFGFELDSGYIPSRDIRGYIRSYIRAIPAPRCIQIGVYRLVYTDLG